MMETRDEFIKELKKEVDSLIVKYERDAADDEGRKLECFKEYKDLIEIYMVRLASSEYDVDECKHSLHALGAVCKTRLEKISDILNENDPEITDDMSVDQMKEIVSTQFKNLSTGTTAAIVNTGICRLIMHMVLPSKSEIEAMIEKVSKLGDDAFEKIAVRLEEGMSEYDFELGCDKHDIKLLEDLMGEQYPEFDAFLGR